MVQGPQEDVGSLGDDKRQYARTEEDFPIEYTPISKEEFVRLSPDYARWRTADRGETPLNPESFLEALRAKGAEARELELLRQTARMLSVVERKLDRLLRLLDKKGSSLEMEKGICRDLSGSGMRFSCRWPLTKGWLLRVVIPLPPLHPVTVSALAEVVESRSGALPSGSEPYDVAVHFVSIHDDDREELIAYNFKRQRELARQKASLP